MSRTAKTKVSGSASHQPTTEVFSIIKVTARKIDRTKLLELWSRDRTETKLPHFLALLHACETSDSLADIRHTYLQCGDVAVADILTRLILDRDFGYSTLLLAILRLQYAGRYADLAPAIQGLVVAAIIAKEEVSVVSILHNYLLAATDKTSRSWAGVARSALCCELILMGGATSSNMLKYFAQNSDLKSMQNRFGHISQVISSEFAATQDSD